MKKFKKTSCNNQGIKRFLSPQPSNIPCKMRRKQIDNTNECIIQKRKDICLLNSKRQYDEIDRTAKSNLQVAADKPQDLNANNTPNKFDWNSLLRDPGEMQESRYPVTLNTFQKMTYSLNVVNCILKDIKNATSLDFINDDLMKERVLKNFYIQFYENPQIRTIYQLETKACPTFVKKKIMQIPTLQSNEVNEEVASVNNTHTGAVSKPTALSVPPEPNRKSIEQERVEAQSTKAQENKIPSQQANANSRDHANVLYIAKNILFMNEEFLRRHISRNIQQVEKQQIIFERINAELLQRKNYVKPNEEISKHTPVHEILDDVLIDINKSPEVSSATVTKEQCIEHIKKLFFTEYPKSNTLAYALRFHNDLKRRILSAILEMTIDEFEKYTKIHNAPEIYDDTKLLSDCYNYAIKAPKIWPVNLYMQLSDLFEYLKSKGITLNGDNFEDISPMLLHWTDLVAITNYDEIMQWDFYRCKGEKFGKFTELNAYREAFYQKCWLHNTWLHEVPKLNIEVQKQLTTDMVVVDNAVVNEESNKNSNLETELNATAAETSTLNEVKVAHEPPINQMPPATTEHTEVTNIEPTNLKSVDGADRVEVSDMSVQSTVANAEHSQDTSAEHLTESNEDLATQDMTEISAMEQTAAVNEAQNILHTATVNLQTTTTAVVETISKSNGNMVANNHEIDAQQRIQTAKKLYFYEVEKSCTLPYLLRLHNGLKRHILHAILQMSFTEFKQYTHIHNAAEIYKNNELLQHCYDFVVKKPHVWPVNLYMRLVDLYKYLKTKGITLTAADLKHVSPKLLHWQDLITTTNYDYIVFWDYYRCSGKKLRRNKTLLNAYRQSFYEKCWFYDSWIWHTPKVSANILGDDVAEEEDKKIAIFEKSVITHAMAEGVEESDTSIENVTTQDESGTTCELPLAAANVMENLVQPTSNTQNVSTVVAESQTSTTCANSLTVMREPVAVEQNGNPNALLCKAIKTEKLSPLDKLQFNLINDEENYECVPLSEDIVDLEGSLSANESQEELLLPLANSENLLTHDANLSIESPKHNGTQQTAQMSDNMETECIIAQESGLELKDELTQLLPECEVEMEIATYSAEEEEQQQQSATQQPQTDQVSERVATITEQPQSETSTLAAQDETCTTQEQQTQMNADAPHILTSEESGFPAYISREVKQELLQHVQQKQTQHATQEPKKSHIEVATALTRIIAAQKQQLKQQQPTLEQRSAEEKQQPAQKQIKSTIENQNLEQQEQQTPLSAPEQQHKKQRQEIAVEKRATQKQTTQQQQQEKSTAKITELQSAQKEQQLPVAQPKAQVLNGQQSTPQQQQENSTAKITELQLTQKEQQLLVAQPKAQVLNVQQSTPQQQQQPILPIVVVPLPTLQQQKEIAIEKQAARKQRRSVDQQTTQQQQQLKKTQKTQRKSQIIEKPKFAQTQKKSEPQQLASAQQKPSQPSKAEIPQIENQMVVALAATKELPQRQQLVSSIVAKAADRQTQPESAQQLTQPALPNNLLQQQQLATENQNENQLREEPQQLTQNQLVQQQTIAENINASQQTEIQFISQQLHSIQSTAQQQQQFSQPQQFILQHTSTQIQEELMIRPTGTLSQDSPNNLPMLMKLSTKQTATTTKTKAMQTTKSAKHKTAKNSDYVPQLTHVFQPLPVALNTKKAPTPPSINNDLPPSSVIATSNLQPLEATTAALEVQNVAASSITATPPQANTMLLTLPVTMNAASTCASTSSLVYTLSGDSTFFNSSELLKAIENYQLQYSQQQQLTQPEQLSEQLSGQQSSQLVCVQPQVAQLQQQQQYDQLQEEQQLEFYQEWQVAQQQQEYQAAIQMPDALAMLECVPEQQQQLQQQTYQLLLQQQTQQQELQQESFQLILQQEQQQPQPMIFQLVDVNQAPYNDGEIEQPLWAEQTETPNFVLHTVQAESTRQKQLESTLVTGQHMPQTNTTEMLQVNVWLEHNYDMPCTQTTRVLTPLPSPKGVCRMRARPHAKPFFFRRLLKIDYFRELTAQNIADYQLQCNSLGKPYLQVKICTTHLRTVLSGDILAALFPRYAPDLVKNLQLVLHYLGEFHFNAWKQREQRKLISKCTHRTLHILCAHILLLFFEYSTPFQTKCLDLAKAVSSGAQRDLSSTAESRLRTDDMFDDLSLAIEPCILAEMAELKRNL